MKQFVEWVLLTIALTFAGGAFAEDYTQREDVQAYIAELVAEHRFTEAELKRLFGHAERKQSIIDAISRPAEKTWKWHEYRDLFMDDDRIENGVAFWEENDAALKKAYGTYGVPPEYIVAIIGVETRFGRVLGGYRVLDALITLGFDYPPRADFFRGELTHFLLLAREEEKDPRDLKGSYAGAMGFGQFIPSSYRAYAVDFDGDGIRDIWSNTTDAIGSVANYFSEHGWQGELPVVVEARLTDPKADALANTTLALTHTVGSLRKQGVIAQGVADEHRATLLRMEAADGIEYWLGLHDFYVITRYNRSRLYAMAVHDLSQAIRAEYLEEVAAR